MKRLTRSAESNDDLEKEAFLRGIAGMVDGWSHRHRARFFARVIHNSTIAGRSVATVHDAATINEIVHLLANRVIDLLYGRKNSDLGLLSLAESCGAHRGFLIRMVRNAFLFDPLIGRPEDAPELQFCETCDSRAALYDPSMRPVNRTWSDVDLLTSCYLCGEPMQGPTTAD